MSIGEKKMSEREKSWEKKNEYSEEEMAYKTVRKVITRKRKKQGKKHDAIVRGKSEGNE